jgi:hypothetical protein
MVVDDLHVLGAGTGPTKAHAKLIIDADAMLSGTIASERLQPIAGRHSQIVETFCDFQLTQLSSRDGFDACKAPDSTPARKRFRVFASKRFNHDSIITRHVIIVKFENPRMKQPMTARTLTRCRDSRF